MLRESPFKSVIVIIQYLTQTSVVSFLTNFKMAARLYNPEGLIPFLSHNQNIFRRIPRGLAGLLYGLI
jgi:hypothetical protein